MVCAMESTKIRFANLRTGLQKLVLLNILLSGEEDVVSTIPTQRLVFLAKNLIECFQSDTKSLGLKAEILKTLTFIIPGLAEIYGSHWEDILEILNEIFAEVGGGEEGLPVLSSSFRLFIRLKTMAEGDSNDDLQDAWSERKIKLFNGVASTVGKFGKFPNIFLSVIWLTHDRCVNPLPSASRCYCGDTETLDQYHSDRETRGCQWGVLSSHSTQSGGAANCIHNSSSIHPPCPGTGVL